MNSMVSDVSNVCSLVVLSIVNTYAVIWGLDEHGYFKSGEAGSGSLFSQIRGLCKSIAAIGHEAASETSSAVNVAEKVLMDLKEVHSQLLAERQVETERTRSNKQKGKHLLFLFQRDLLPGVSGKILESKGQRDNIAVKAVSWQAKVAGWTFIFLLDVGMLFYILLFAVSQTVHRQGAWALSFVMWLVVEILFVSSATVIFTHVFVPSLIMNDVKKIKLKLADSIRAFNSSVRKRRGAQGTDAEGPEAFNAASYLFVSTRLAQQWSDLREAQIIAQFRTPWPKQSYQRETDVSQGYSKKYTALYRSASVIAIFFLTNLLNIPPAFQDMVIHMATTAAIGYTTLLHIDLYEVFPALVILPTVLVCVVVHFLVQANKASEKQKLEQMHPAEESAPVWLAAHRDKEVQKTAKKEHQHIEEAKTGQDDFASLAIGAEGGGGDDLSQLHMPASAALTPPSWHITRKQSAMYGARVLHTLRHEVDGAQQAEAGSGSSPDGAGRFTNRVADSESSSGSDSDEDGSLDEDDQGARVDSLMGHIPEASEEEGESRGEGEEESVCGSDDWAAEFGSSVFSSDEFPEEQDGESQDGEGGEDGGSEGSAQGSEDVGDPVNAAEKVGEEGNEEAGGDSSSGEGSESGSEGWEDVQRYEGDAPAATSAQGRVCI
jgi:hypothetical protein